MVDLCQGRNSKVLEACFLLSFLLLLSLSLLQGTVNQQAFWSKGKGEGGYTDSIIRPPSRRRRDRTESKPSKPGEEDSNFLAWSSREIVFVLAKQGRREGGTLSDAVLLLLLLLGPPPPTQYTESEPQQRGTFRWTRRRRRRRQCC